MKALSIHPLFAAQVAWGEKKYEFRTWSTPYRGDLLICSTADKVHDLIPGHALAVVTISDVLAVTLKNYKDFDVPRQSVADGVIKYAWKLENPRLIVPFPVKGNQRLYDLDVTPEILPTPQTEEEEDALFEKYWEPLLY